MVISKKSWKDGQFSAGSNGHQVVEATYRKSRLPRELIARLRDLPLSPKNFGIPNIMGSTEGVGLTGGNGNERRLKTIKRLYTKASFAFYSLGCTNAVTRRVGYIRGIAIAKIWGNMESRGEGWFHGRKYWGRLGEADVYWFEGLV